MTDEEPLILSVEYRGAEKELVRALQYHDWGNPPARRRLLLKAAGFLIAGLCCYVLSATFNVPWLLGVGTLAIMIGVYWPLILVGHPKSLAKFYAKQPRFKDVATVSVTPDALVIRSNSGELRLDWQSIREIVVTGELTLFVLGRYQLASVPWRAFEAPSAAQRFTELAREYWHARKDVPRGPLVVPDEVAEALGPERVVVQYDLTPREVRGLIVGQIRRKPRFLLTVGIVAISVGLLVAGLAGPAYGVAVGVAVVLMMAALVMGLALFGVRGAKGVLGPHLLAAGPGALWATSSEHSQGWTKWNVITHIEGNATEILIFRGPDFVTSIPRRCFATPHEADQFLTQLTRWRVASLSLPLEQPN